MSIGRTAIKLTVIAGLVLVAVALTDVPRAIDPSKGAGVVGGYGWTCAGLAYGECPPAFFAPPGSCSDDYAVCYSIDGQNIGYCYPQTACSDDDYCDPHSSSFCGQVI
jgi:hypothetical protein